MKAARMTVVPLTIALAKSMVALFGLFIAVLRAVYVGTRVGYLVSQLNE
jgi:hypothetical protein